MKESSFKLQDKTIFLAGPFNGITQSIIRGMAELGADVAFVSDSVAHASRFTDGVTEARDIHPNHGRAAHFHLPLNTAEQVQEAIGRVAQSLGRMDILVNAMPLTWDGKTSIEQVSTVSTTLIEKLNPFFTAKPRGRVIYVFEDQGLDSLLPNCWPQEFRTSFLKMMNQQASDLRGIHTTVNALSVGITEDFLLKNFPKSPSIRLSLDALKKEHGDVRLVESSDIASAVAYLSSAVAGSITGQVLRMTHGMQS